MRNTVFTVTLAILVCLTGFLASSKPALATYPGANGRIAYGMKVNGNIDDQAAFLKAIQAAMDRSRELAAGAS